PAIPIRVGPRARLQRRFWQGAARISERLVPEVGVQVRNRIVAPSRFDHVKVDLVPLPRTIRQGGRPGSEARPAPPAVRNWQGGREIGHPRLVVCSSVRTRTHEDWTIANRTRAFTG